MYPEKLEVGTLNVVGIAGLNEGIEYILDKGIENIRKIVATNVNRFIDALEQMNNVILYTQRKRPVAGVVSLNIGNIDSETISDVLVEDFDIAIRPGAHCAPLAHKALGTEKQGIVRFSFSSFNTIEEVDFAINALKTIVTEVD